MNSENAKKFVSIVVPVFNEEWSVVPLYSKILNAFEGRNENYELLYVDDGSSDGSWDRICELTGRDPRVKGLHLRKNYGIAAALMAGFDHAAGEIIVTMDGNLQHDPADIGALLAKMDEGYDVCTGWRKDRSSDIGKRDLPNLPSIRLISWISGVELHDYQCSLKAYKRHVVQGLKLYGDMYRLIPVYAAGEGAKVTEIPITQHPRVHGHGTDQLPLKNAVKLFLDLVLIKFFQRYAQRPMYVFGFLGVVNFAVAVAAAVGAVFYKFFGGKSFVQTPLPLLAVICGMLGCMCILVGLLAEIIMRIYFESQNKPIYGIAEKRNLESS